MKFKLFQKKSKQKSKEELQDFWRDPYDGANKPQDYVKANNGGMASSKFLLEIIKNLGPKNMKILEIGCNAGRNLNHLYQNGYQNLTGLEISTKAIEVMKQEYSDMANSITIYNKPVEEIIKSLGTDEFDIVFTMAVLEHIHKDSEWIFEEICRITKTNLVTIEDEKTHSWRHFPRNYKKIFENLGMKNIKTINCSEVPGLFAKFNARIFSFN